MTSCIHMIARAYQNNVKNLLLALTAHCNRIVERSGVVWFMLNSIKPHCN